MSQGPNVEQTQAPRVVVLTMVRDEADMLPHWLDYYGRQVGEDNLVVLDDNSVDGSTDDLPCTVFRLPQAPWKASWAQTRTGLVNGISRGLLACYDVVVFSDVDEFLVPDPARYESLVHYLSSVPDREAIAPLALNVLHNPRLEPVLDPAQPLLKQRRFVKFAPGMCKPLIKRIPADWGRAFHAIGTPFEIDRDLVMLHLKYYDVSSLKRVSEHRHARHQEGRGHPESAWALESDELISRLLSWVQTPEGHDVPEFDPSEADLDEIVHRKSNSHFRSHGPQLTAMENNPLRRLPERFSTAV
jgi:hypothetical protein